MKQLIKFSASWCSPCKSLAGNFKHVDMKDVKLKEIDIEENSELANEYGVRGVPTMVLVENGKELKRHTGVLMADGIEKFIHN
jgi:thioredoxin 1